MAEEWLRADRCYCVRKIATKIDMFSRCRIFVFLLSWTKGWKHRRLWWKICVKWCAFKWTIKCTTVLDEMFDIRAMLFDRQQTLYFFQVGGQYNVKCWLGQSTFLHSEGVPTPHLNIRGLLLLACRRAFNQNFISSINILEADYNKSMPLRFSRC